MYKIDLFRGKVDRQMHRVNNGAKNEGKMKPLLTLLFIHTYMKSPLSHLQRSTLVESESKRVKSLCKSTPNITCGKDVNWDVWRSC